MPETVSGGGAGAVYESGTTAITGQNFHAIVALEDSVFSTLTSVNWSGDTTSGFPLPKGVTIYGMFTAFTLTSGKVLAYKNPY